MKTIQLVHNLTPACGFAITLLES